MPVVIAWIIGGILSALGTLVGRVLISLLVGFVAFSGIDAMLGWLKGQVLANLTSLSPDLVGLLGSLGVGTVISIYSSAWLTVVTIKGMQSGTVKKMVTR